jgi:hypothetical protein
MLADRCDSVARQGSRGDDGSWSQRVILFVAVWTDVFVVGLIAPEPGQTFALELNDEVAVGAVNPQDDPCRLTTVQARAGVPRVQRRDRGQEVAPLRQSDVLASRSLRTLPFLEGHRLALTEPVERGAAAR